MSANGEAYRIFGATTQFILKEWLPWLYWLNLALLKKNLNLFNT